MKDVLAVVAFLFAAALIPLEAQEGRKLSPPVGVPADATYYGGKWYRIYLEKNDWKSAKAKCQRPGGSLVVVHDAATQEFIRNLADGLDLWLGATDEAIEGRWMWVDGTQMTFKAWDRHEPNNGSGVEHYLHIWRSGLWNDSPNKSTTAIGFICQWKDR
jgi:Lectin C-type domain